MIRYATKEDLPTVYAMYLDALDEIKESVLPVDEDKALDYVIKCYNKAPCLLLEKDGRIIGFCGLTTLAPEYTSVVILRDYMFYIEPEHRGLKNFIALCKAAQGVSDQFKLPLYVEHMISGDIARHLKFLGMVKARPLGVTAIYGA